MFTQKNMRNSTAEERKAIGIVVSGDNCARVSLGKFHATTARISSASQPTPGKKSVRHGVTLWVLNSSKYLYRYFWQFKKNHTTIVRPLKL